MLRQEMELAFPMGGAIIHVRDLAMPRIVFDVGLRASNEISVAAARELCLCALTSLEPVFRAPPKISFLPFR